MQVDMTVVKQRMQVDMQQEPTVIGTVNMFKANIRMALANGLRDAADKGAPESSLKKISSMAGLLDNNRDFLAAFIEGSSAKDEPLPGSPDAKPETTEAPPELSKLMEELKKETSIPAKFLAYLRALKSVFAQGLKEADDNGCTDEQLGTIRSMDTLLSHDDDTLAALVANTPAKAEPLHGGPAPQPSIGAMTPPPENNESSAEEREEEKKKGVIPGEGSTTPATGPTIDLATKSVSSGADGGTSDGIGKGPVQEPAEGAPAGPASSDSADAAGGATHVPQTTINSGTKL